MPPERFTIGPDRYARLTLLALGALVLIVFTGAAVRLTGSGLGCENWPKCGSSVAPPLELHALTEFGNRVLSGLVGVVAAAAGLMAFRRRPYRRDLALIGLALPAGVLAQGILGGFTVKHELEPGFVMAHFLLSMVLLAGGVALVWRAHREEPAPERDRTSVWATRALLPLSAVVVVAGTITTAAGPHPGSAGSDQPVHRLDFKGVDTLNWMYHQHGRLGTLLLLSTLAVLLLAHRRGAPWEARRPLAVMAGAIVVQGSIGLLQWELSLPAGLVWAHVVMATTIWLAALWAVAAAGVPARAGAPAPEALQAGA